MSDRRLHVLLVTHFYPAHGGGIERVAAELAAALARAPGWRITWMASDCDAPPVALACAAEGEGRVDYLPAASWNGVERRLGVPFPLWSPGALQQLWQAVGAADAVHLHDALYFGNAAAWLFARLRGVPLLVTQHVGTVPYRSRVLRAVHALANRTLGRWVLGSADRVVFISPAVREEFARFCRFRRPPVYLANGVDTAVFRPQGALADDDAIAATRRRGGRVFLFVGRFVEKKGLPVLRELATALSDDLWTFAGHGPQDPAAWGLPNVRVVRGLSGATLAPYYRAADLLVLPSVGEGFPLVVQEAMACGTPALVGEETAAGCPEARALLLVEKVGAGDTASRWAQRLREWNGAPKCVPERVSERVPGLRAEVAGFARARWSWATTAAAYAALIASPHATPEE